MSRLSLDGVGVELGGATLVDDVRLSCSPGAFVGLLGPNGSGKSTVLRTVYRALRPTSGAVLVDDQDVFRDLRPRDAARRVAALTQDNGLAGELTVRELVSIGRTPHQGAWAVAGAADRVAVDDTLALVGVAGLVDRPLVTLSGGERQRVLLARALVQRPSLLVLDEPTNHLDVSTQLQLLDLVASLGITVLAALHDLNLAAAYCDTVHVLHAGHVVASGPPSAVLTPDTVRAVFGVQAHTGVHPVTGRLHLAFSTPDTRRAPASMEGIL